MRPFSAVRIRAGRIPGKLEGFPLNGGNSPLLNKNWLGSNSRISGFSPRELATAGPHLSEKRKAGLGFGGNDLQERAVLQNPIRVLAHFRHKDFMCI